MSEGLSFKVDKSASPPRLISIRGTTLPEGAVSAPVATETESGMVSNFAVGMVSAAFQWVEESRGMSPDK